MSLGEFCQACKQGKLRPFLLSSTEAIIKCSNTDCDGYLNYLPKESIIASGLPQFSHPPKRSSSRVVSRCNSPCTAFSPANSQDSSTDQEVAKISTIAHKHHIAVGSSLHTLKLHQHDVTASAIKPTTFSSSYEAPKTALPATVQHPGDLSEFERILQTKNPYVDINNATTEDVDYFLDAITAEVPLPRPTLSDSVFTNRIPSHCSAFLHVGVSNISDSTQQSGQDQSDSSSINSVQDQAMLDENQFSSPASSVVSEDSGYNDEIPIVVAVSEAGTRGGQAATKTTSSTLPTQTEPQLEKKTPSDGAHDSTFVLPPIAAALQEQTNGETTASTQIKKCFLSSLTLPTKEVFKMPTPLLPSCAISESSYLEFADVQTASPLHITSPDRNFSLCYNPSVMYPKLSLTDFLQIFEQNILSNADSNSNDIASKDKQDESLDMNMPVASCRKWSISSDNTCSSVHMVHNDEAVNNSKSVANLSRDASSTETESIDCKQASQSTESFTLLEVANKITADKKVRSSVAPGRPHKRKYKKRIKPDVNDLSLKENSSNAAEDIEFPISFNAELDNSLMLEKKNLQVSDIASEGSSVTDKDKLSSKRKRNAQENTINTRKSSRKVNYSATTSNSCTNTSESTCYAAVSSASLVNVRPSLAALLPPLPNHPLGKSSSHGRNNKRFKASHPFRHLASK